MNLRKRRLKIAAEVNTSSLNDIMFFLLLFFLIASTITNPNVIKLLLPQSDSGQVISKKTVTVTIDKDLNYFIDKERVNVDQIEPKLSEIKKTVQELTIVLYVDRTIAIQDVVKVMDIANKLKLKIVLATETKK